MCSRFLFLSDAQHSRLWLVLSLVSTTIAVEYQRAGSGGLVLLAIIPPRGEFAAFFILRGPSAVGACGKETNLVRGEDEDGCDCWRAVCSYHSCSLLLVELQPF